MSSIQKDQNHPQEKRDRQIVNQLLAVNTPTPHNLAELARLRIRYQGFPGARDIQRDLDLLLANWQLTEEQLFAQTRQIHAQATVYRGDSQQQEDWF